MQETIIQAVMLLGLNVTLEVGHEFHGRDVVSILRNSDKFTAYDDNNEVICEIEHTKDVPLVIEYKTIIVDGPEQQHSLVKRVEAETPE